MNPEENQPADALVLQDREGPGMTYTFLTRAEINQLKAESNDLRWERTVEAIQRRIDAITRHLTDQRVAAQAILWHATGEGETPDKHIQDLLKKLTNCTQDELDDLGGQYPNLIGFGNIIRWEPNGLALLRAVLVLLDDTLGAKK